MSIYLQIKVGRDVGFVHIRPQQNPKKNDDAERGGIILHNNKSDQRLSLLVGSLSLSPLARPYSFFFPTLPPWEKSMWCWSGTTQQLRSRTSEKLGFLNMLGASESMLKWSFCILGYVCSCLALDRHTDIGEWLLQLDIGNDAVLCFYVDIRQCI